MSEVYLALLCLAPGTLSSNIFCVRDHAQSSLPFRTASTRSTGVHPRSSKWPNPPEQDSQITNTAQQPMVKIYTMKTKNFLRQVQGAGNTARLSQDCTSKPLFLWALGTGSGAGWGEGAGAGEGACFYQKSPVHPVSNKGWTDKKSFVLYRIRTKPKSAKINSLYLSRSS